MQDKQHQNCLVQLVSEILYAKIKLPDVTRLK